MPMISDQDFAAFQQWKSGGGAAAAPNAPAATWQPPSSGDLPAPVGTPGQYGGMDYTAQNAEIARRAKAASYDPNSPTYIPPEERARQQAANQMQGAANPGWTWNDAGAGGYWTPDDAHNNAGGVQAFQDSWQALGKANPEAFEVPTDAQGRPIDARTGEAMPGGTTAAQRAQTPAQQAYTQQPGQTATSSPQWAPPVPPGHGASSGPSGPHVQWQGWGTSAPAPDSTSSSAPPAPKTWDPQKGWQPPKPSPGGTY